ncbi:hypothetical protein [Solidesulfovibrio sp.]|uniref:hypothetical protein n=1 Tax=Solidesulfovibrio sp. TaxID=2910990 RepID=UPI002637F269|nr:hypothetical protein [Solidesulfovibrio sp.]
MATDKSLPDADDDIIDLTDLVEDGPAGAKAAADDGPVDMSFEQELEDLFGDADPGLPKAAAKPDAAPASDEDDDVIDLTGLAFDEGEPAKPDAASAPGQDDALDLSGFGPGEVGAKPDAPAARDADEDALDLSGFGIDDEIEMIAATPAEDADADAFDLSGLGIDVEAPKPKGEVDEADDDLDFAGLGLDDAAAPAPAAAVAPDAADVAVDDLFAEADKPAPAAPGDEAMDLAAMDLDGLAKPADAAIGQDDAAMADLLGELPDAAGLDDIDVSELSNLSSPEAPAQAPAPAGEEAPEPSVAQAVAGAAALGAVAGAAMGAAAPARVGSIDLGALDNLIDAAKGPPPEPEPVAAPDSGRLDELAQRLDALETAADDLRDRLESVATTDNEALADALSLRLEEALAERLEAFAAGLPQPPDTAGLHAGIMAEMDTRAVKDRTKLLAELATTLDKRFDALVAGLPTPAEPADLSGPLEELGQSLQRLEAESREREASFKDFASAMETRLAELRRELPEPGEFATRTSVSEGLETLRESLARDIAGNLDERLAELRRELREALAGDIATGLDERLAALAGEARQAAREEAQKAAREEAQALGEVLSGRIEALETDRLDPDALAAKIRVALTADLPDAETMARLGAKPDRQDLDDALAALRRELTGEREEEAATLRGETERAQREAVDALRREMAEALEKGVPKAAAAVIREEIAALLKEFS